MKKITVQVNSSGPLSLTIAMDTDEGVDLHPQGTTLVGSSHQDPTVPNNGRFHDDDDEVLAYDNEDEEDDEDDKDEDEDDEDDEGHGGALLDRDAMIAWEQRASTPKSS
jgi:hypothetical protein